MSNPPGLETAWWTLLGLAFLVVVVAGWFVWYRKNQSDNGERSAIKILSVRTIGPRERIVVAKIGDRIVALGHTPANVNFLFELESFPDLPSQTAPEQFARRLEEWLSVRPNR